ncbi:hypothetical protein H5410_051816 [Solanum commersonii]|uniref:Uncharacterized protein n=1 Tax=Solanum commersonii TaxID=4109 RepID=A0A9J5X165_SOLCO|nr:hypothetical protein H5410_051816 [Solanum commersonii]
MEVYEHLIHLFYKNHRSLKAEEIEYLVLGKCIFLDYKKFDSIFGISCSGVIAHPKNYWPYEYIASFDQAKHELTRVIAHIVTITLLPRAGSHSTLSLLDILLTYCIVSRIKIHLFPFILSAMANVISEPSSLPFNILITCILESHFHYLGDFSPILIK